MKTETLGEGEPEYAVVTHLHGDEPAGRRAVKKLKSGDMEFKKPVKFVIANEKAAEQNMRFLESDLNRSFPGDPESDLYEERLAAELVEELEGLNVLDIHSTHSEPVPFAILSDPEDSDFELVPSTGIRSAVVFPGGESMIGCLGGVTVEVGPQGSEEAVEMAYKILVNFLAAEGVIEAEYEKSEPGFYEYYETVEGSGYEFTARNFELVRKGEIYARKDAEKKVAGEDFYPVLMSTHGYENLVGFKARKLEK